MNFPYNRVVSFVFIVLFICLLTPGILLAKEKAEKEDSFTLPKNVHSIMKANTFPNTAEDDEVIEPSAETKALIEALNIKIENPNLIKLLNESTINPSPIAIGYRANIYLGRWPLNYDSENTSVIWDYQLINENELNNVGGDEVLEIRYIQLEEREIKGALTSKIDDPEAIKRMMLKKSKEKTKLPLSFSTVFGANTKLENFYHVPKNKIGYLNGYAPAINETGQVTFGEVYLHLKGSNKELKIKNVTKQGIGAWIPIQDHVALSFQLK